MHTPVSFFCVAILATMALAGEEERSFAVGGIELKLDAAGAIAQWRIRGVEAAAPPPQAGLWVKETPTGREVPVALGARRARLTRVSGDSARLTARIDQETTHLLISGEVEDLRKRDELSVSVVFRLPFRQATWQPSISERIAPGQVVPKPKTRRERLPPGAAVLETIERDGMAQDVLPLACVTDGQRRAGAALAIPPDFACKFRFAYLAEQGCLELSLPLGLSAVGSGPYRSRAPFRFLIMAVDGRWGLRDALRQYYAVFPDAFRRRTSSSGLWLFAVPSFDKVPDPANYAFWEGPRLTQLPQAEQHKVETYPYIIVGQREITYLKDKPRGYDDIVAALREEPARTKKSSWSWPQVKDAVAQCGLHDSSGKWVHQVRETEWGGSSITFPVNPSPFLPSSAERPTVASTTLQEVANLLKEHPSLSGIYVDSLASWGSFRNYRHEHFAAARAPLTHDAAGRVYVPNWMPHLDFLRAMRERISGRLVFGNGIRPGRAFCAFECDVLGVETSIGDLQHRRNIDFYRAVAGNKPFLFLYYHPQPEIPRELVERYVQRFVAMGFSPEVKSHPWGRHKQRDADIFARFLPLYRRLDLAGWQPVTNARLDQESVWLERFGQNAPELYFTLYNPTDQAVQTRISIDWQTLGLSGPCGLSELVEGGRRLNADAPLSLPPQSLRLVQVAERGR